MCNWITHKKQFWGLFDMLFDFPWRYMKLCEKYRFCSQKVIRKMSKIIKTAPNIGFMGIFLSEICLRSFLVFSKFFIFFLRNFLRIFSKDEKFRKKPKMIARKFRQKNTHKPYIWGCFDDFWYFFDNFLTTKPTFFTDVCVFFC